MTADFVRRLPKAELHVHLEGTLEPDLLMAMAERNAVPVPWADAEELRRQYEFSGLEHFLSLYFRGCDVLRTRQDFHDLAAAYLTRAAAQGVVRAEMFFGPQSFLDKGIALADQLGGLFDAIDEARERDGIDGQLLISAHRHRSAADALELFDLVAPFSSRILGFGLGSAEAGNPPGRFVDYAEACHRRGFPLAIHAGEEGPAGYVTEALDVCHADRIDHGVAAATEPELVRRLADEQTPLTLCPLSNLRLGVVDSLAVHPFEALRTAGVLVTVNSDDPSYFGGYVAENYDALAAQFGYDEDVLVQLARNSIAGSFAPAEVKAALYAAGRP